MNWVEFNLRSQLIYQNFKGVYLNCKKSQGFIILVSSFFLVSLQAPCILNHGS